MLARVLVTLKPGVLDPAGKAVERSLQMQGYPEVGSVRIGKYIEVRLHDVTDVSVARFRVDEMCRKLLANTAVESYRVELE